VGRKVKNHCFKLYSTHFSREAEKCCKGGPLPWYGPEADSRRDRGGASGACTLFHAALNESAPALHIALQSTVRLQSLTGNCTSESTTVFFIRGSASGHQGFRRNSSKLSGTKFPTKVLSGYSSMDTWIIAQGAVSNANICGRFRCSRKVEKHWSLLESPRKSLPHRHINIY